MVGGHPHKLPCGWVKWPKSNQPSGLILFHSGWIIHRAGGVGDEMVFSMAKDRMEHGGTTPSSSDNILGKMGS